MSQDEFELNFLSQDEFELKSMEGKTTRYRRAQPYSPSPTDLKSFTTRYGSDEVGSVFNITPTEQGLLFRREGSLGKGSELKPVARDTFQAGQIIVRFHRDKSREVVAFGFTNPLLRDLRFTRLSDRTSRP